MLDLDLTILWNFYLRNFLIRDPIAFYMYSDFDYKRRYLWIHTSSFNPQIWNDGVFVSARCKITTDACKCPFTTIWSLKWFQRSYFGILRLKVGVFINYTPYTRIYVTRTSRSLGPRKAIVLGLNSKLERFSRELDQIQYLYTKIVIFY